MMISKHVRWNMFVWNVLLLVLTIGRDSSAQAELRKGTYMRSYHKSPQYRCARCGCVRLLSDMTWQLGRLLCRQSGCIDRFLVGTGTDNKIVAARGVSAWSNSTEGQPELILQEPIVSSSPEDIIF